MARLVGKNGCQNNMCYNEIGLCGQNVDTILEVTQLGGPMSPFIERENLNFDFL